MDSTSSLRAHDVFTPNDFPLLTYVVRGKRYEEQLANYLRIPGTIVTVSGPSKSGKTVLVRRVVKDSNLVLVPCGGVTTSSQLWDRVLDKVNAPHSVSSASSMERGVAIGGELGAPALFATSNNIAKVSAQWHLKQGASQSKTETRRGTTQIAELLARQDVVVLLDDFHFIPREAQAPIAEELKAMAAEGVRLAITVAAHRADDLERATSQLTGRVANVGIDPWNPDELLEIAYEGFARLNSATDILLPHDLAREAAGTPQLMQLLCLMTARHCGFESRAAAPKPLHVSDEQFAVILKMACGMTGKQTVAQLMLNGPLPRGTPRDSHDLHDSGSGDVYYCILHALVADPATLELGYDEIKKRVEDVVKPPPPSGASITSALEQMSELTKEPSTKEPAVEWDAVKRQFSFIDPYLWFYLRWSDFLDK